MKKFKVTLELAVPDMLGDFETDEMTVVNMVEQKLHDANDAFPVEANEVDAREICVEEEEEPESPIIEEGDIVTSSIAREKYAVDGELRVIGIEGVDELIVVKTEDREEIRLHRDELDTVIKEDGKSFDVGGGIKK